MPAVLKFQVQRVKTKLREIVEHTYNINEYVFLNAFESNFYKMEMNETYLNYILFRILNWDQKTKEKTIRNIQMYKCNIIVFIPLV